MTERPFLDKNLDSTTFRDFYYLKEELVDFCRKNGLPVSGGKLEITERIARFLDTGEALSASTVRKKLHLHRLSQKIQKLKPILFAPKGIGRFLRSI